VPVAGGARAAALALLLVGTALGAAGSALPARADPTEEEGGAGADPDYTEGKRAIERADWPRAVALLTAAVRRDARNADIHNQLGFAYRHAGDFAAAFAHYDEALRLNPRHRGAHEYAGEAALLADNLPRAERHLAALEQICLLPCEELDDLRIAIAAYRKRKESGERSPGRSRIGRSERGCLVMSLSCLRVRSWPFCDMAGNPTEGRFRLRNGHHCSVPSKPVYEFTA
jgi:tetratricopeptide (TPR) repeat protein